MSTDLKAIAARINKKLGEDAIVLGSDIRMQTIPRVTSGLLSLDAALGGGWPTNQWNEVYGDESSGKTATVLKTISANQALDPEWNVVWIAAEEFVPEYAHMLGCDLKRIHVVDTNVMEVAFDIVLEYLDARAMDCVVIDSLAALVPSEEGEKSMEESQMALGARLTGKFLRKARKNGRRSLLVEERPVVGFIINQFREKIGVMYGDNRTTPGGRAKNFHYFTRVELRRSDWIDNGAPGDNKLRVGQTIKARVVKNKSAPGQRTAAFDFYFDKGGDVQQGQFDAIKDIFSTGYLMGVIERTGAYYMFDEHKWHGRAGIVDALRDDPALVQAIRDRVLAL